MIINSSWYIYDTSVSLRIHKISQYATRGNSLKIANCKSVQPEEMFIRAMHFSAKHGLAIACRLSVCLSLTLVDCDHIGWNSSEIISPFVSLGCSLSEDPNIRGLLQGGTPGNFGPK